MGPPIVSDIASRYAFNSDDVAISERHGVVREIVGRQMGLDIDVYRDAPLRVALDAIALPGLMTFMIDTRAIGERTPSLIAQGSDLVGMAISTRHSCYTAHRKYEHVVEAGAATLLSWTETATLRTTAGESNSSIGLLVPRDTLQRLVPRLEDDFGRLIPAGNEALKLLVHYVTLLHRTPAITDPETSLTVASHVRDLIALAAGTSRDMERIAAAGGLKAARMASVKSYIADNLGRHELSVVRAARRHHLTERYLQRLFEGEGTTFSRYLLERRLKRAYDMLASPLHRHFIISAIAYECGFAEIPYFNRAFRSRFGATPSEIRGLSSGEAMDQNGPGA